MEVIGELPILFLDDGTECCVGGETQHGGNHQQSKTNAGDPSGAGQGIDQSFRQKERSQLGERALCFPQTYGHWVDFHRNAALQVKYLENLGQFLDLRLKMNPITRIEVNFGFFIASSRFALSEERENALQTLFNLHHFCGWRKLGPFPTFFLGQETIDLLTIGVLQSGFAGAPSRVYGSKKRGPIQGRGW